MDWLLWFWGFIHGILFCIVVLPFWIRWFMNKKLKELIGGLVR